MNRTECAVLIGTVRELWPNGWRHAPETVEALEVTVDAWLLVLDDVEAHHAFSAVRRLSTRCEFVPPPGQIRREALVGQTGEVPPVDEAWRQVMDAVGRVGYPAAWADGWTGAPADLHPMVARVVRAIGWSTICESDNQTALRAHFGRWYADAVESVLDDVAAPASMPALETGDGPVRFDPHLIGRLDRA